MPRATNWPGADDSPRVTTCGKELLLDGEHLADFRDLEAAAVAALCLNYGMLVGSEIGPDDRDRVQRFFE